MNFIFLLKVSKLREYREYLQYIYFHNSFSILNNKNYNYKNLSYVSEYVKIITIRIINQCKEEKIIYIINNNLF